MTAVTNFATFATQQTAEAQAWSNVTNVYLTDGNVATQIPQFYADNRVLYVSFFNFAIPGTATINGVSLNVLRRRSGGTQGEIVDDFVELIKNGSPVGGIDHASPTTWGDSFATQVYGGSTDLWGYTLTPADVNLATFGARMRLYAITPSDRIAEIDAISITIDYTDPAALPNDVFWQGPVTNT